MPAELPQFVVLRSLSRDGRLLFATRVLRLFAYGLVSVVLVLYLTELGFSETQVGLLLSLTLVGDIVLSLAITTRADRTGRRLMLVAGAVLMALSGLIFAATHSYVLLLLVATAGVFSLSGGEVGPFLPIEQAALSQIVPADRRLDVFAWYNLVGSFATALGALTGGLLVEAARVAGLLGATSYRPVLLAYAAIGALLAAMFLALSRAIEPAANETERAAAPCDATPSRNDGQTDLERIPEPSPSGSAQGEGKRDGDAGARVPANRESRENVASSSTPAVSARPTWLGLHRSHGTVLRLSALFAMDAFGGGFILQSILAYWLHLKFGIEAAGLGGVFMAANMLAGLSALAAGWLARKIGLVNTMVFTHLPSNVLLMLVPLMPTAEWAVALLLLRFSISQMDVPTRQAYTMAVVAPDERAAASGITTVARSVGAAVSPAIATRLIAIPALLSSPLLLAGGIKIVYDLLLWRAFAAVVTDESTQSSQK